MTTTQLALALLLFHLLYDFHLQGPWISAEKAYSNGILTVHALTWALFVYVPIFFATHTVNYGLLVFLFGTHWIIDYFKARGYSDRLLANVGNDPSPGNYLSLWVDQALHLITLAYALYVVTSV